MEKKERRCFVGLLLMNPVFILAGIFIGFDVGDNIDICALNISGGIMIICGAMLLGNKHEN